MASITLKDVPDDLHQRLKSSAERNRRSLNQEALALIDAQLRHQPVDVETLLANIRETRTRYPIKTTQAEIQRLIRQGRK